MDATRYILSIITTTAHGDAEYGYNIVENTNFKIKIYKTIDDIKEYCTTYKMPCPKIDKKVTKFILQGYNNTSTTICVNKIDDIETLEFNNKIAGQYYFNIPISDSDSD